MVDENTTWLVSLKIISISKASGLPADEVPKVHLGLRNKLVAINQINHACLSDLCIQSTTDPVGVSEVKGRFKDLYLFEGHVHCLGQIPVICNCKADAQNNSITLLKWEDLSTSITF